MDQKTKSCERSSSTPNQNSFDDSFPRVIRWRNMVYVYFFYHFDFTPWPAYSTVSDGLRWSLSIDKYNLEREEVSGQFHFLILIHPADRTADRTDKLIIPAPVALSPVALSISLHLSSMVDRL